MQLASGEFISNFLEAFVGSVQRVVGCATERKPSDNDLDQPVSLQLRGTLGHVLEYPVGVALVLCSLQCEHIAL